MFEPIENLFIRRMKKLKGEIPDYYSYELSTETRHKIIGYILDANFSYSGSYAGSGYDELDEIVVAIERELGRSISSRVLSHDKIQGFMFECNTEEFLSSLEIVCKIKIRNSLQYGNRYSNLATNTVTLIESTNKIFKLDKIGYNIVPVGLEDLPMIIVPFDSQYLLIETIKRPRSLLYSKKFDGPLNEFETALDKYRGEDYDSAIIEATNAYESTLKAILTKKNVSFDEKVDKIPQLLDKVMGCTDINPTLKSTFTSFWPVLKNGPNNIRNLSGNAHGQGLDIKKAKQEYADFVLRTVGTYIIFLIERFEASS
ncbi:hypothetical protein HZC07_02170 [Candidatus Micrarchaeota archaeon]|nr:hypothetical protein [Candidatus Micrarchaeota archaeon]